MNRRRFLASMPALGALAAGRTNVIFMVGDDLNTALGCYGNPIVKTPHIDRLAARGVRFDRAYCQFPLCAPSRASFLSGRRPETARVWTLSTPTRKYMADVVMLPEFFRKQGYFSAQAGKIYHTGLEHEDPRSWDFALQESGKTPPESEILDQHRMPGPRNHTMAWARLKTPDEQTPDGIMARKAVELIRKCVKQGRPFFIGLGFRRPHSPYAAPARYFDLYDPSKIPLPRVPAGYAQSLPPAAYYELANQPKLSGDETRRYIAAYYACNSFIDAQVGHVLRTVDELDLWRNTVIVFLGDNGYHTGEHGMWHKMTLFEESARVPLVVYAPGVKGAGGVCRGLVELVDLYPTLAEVCGFAPPAGLEGISLVPWLNDPSRPAKQAVFTMVGRNDDRAKMNNDVTYLGKSVRTTRWRYTEWDEGRRGAELYDERGDPAELVNLAGRPEYKKVVEELRALLLLQAGRAIERDRLARGRTQPAAWPDPC